MKKQKLRFILDRYIWDKKLNILFAIGIFSIMFFIAGIKESLYYVIFAVLGIVSILIFIVDIFVIKRKIKREELISVHPKTFNASIKQTKETHRLPSLLLKLYIIDENKTRYDYYYLNGSEPKFKEYVNVINNSTYLEIKLYKGTNIINTIIADGEVLEDLFVEIKYSKKLRKPIVYNHIKYKRTKKGIYKFEEYQIDDVQRAFENAKQCEELCIINLENKYTKISFYTDPIREFFIEKKPYETFEQIKEELEKNNFLFDQKLRVIYCLGDTEPTSFNMFINETK